MGNPERTYFNANDDFAARTVLTLLLANPLAKRPVLVRTLNRIGPLTWEPPWGIEPQTYALRVRRSGRLS